MINWVTHSKRFGLKCIFRCGDVLFLWMMFHLFSVVLPFSIKYTAQFQLNSAPTISNSKKMFSIFFFFTFQLTYAKNWENNQKFIQRPLNDCGTNLVKKICQVIFILHIICWHDPPSLWPIFYIFLVPESR